MLSTTDSNLKEVCCENIGSVTTAFDTIVDNEAQQNGNGIVAPLLSPERDVLADVVCLAEVARNTGVESGTIRTVVLCEALGPDVIHVSLGCLEKSVVPLHGVEGTLSVQESNGLCPGAGALVSHHRDVAVLSHHQVGLVGICEPRKL